MKVVILCGGLGTRLSEETSLVPKPMVEIGGIPMICHIMQLYSKYGFNDFILALGYKSEVIKQYFLNYSARQSTDLTVDLKNGDVSFQKILDVPWKVQMVDTGLNTLTGGRLKRLESYLKEPFMLTYGDGLSDIDIHDLLRFHKSQNKIGTVTAVRPPARFGCMKFEGDLVTSFEEKPQTGEGWINGGFFVFKPEFLKHLRDDETILEREPLEGLAHDYALAGYRHEGFRQCMDTLRDKKYLEELWASKNPPWTSGARK